MAGTRLILSISFALPFFIIILSAIWIGLIVRNPVSLSSTKKIQRYPAHGILQLSGNNNDLISSTSDSLLYTILFRQQGRYLLQKQQQQNQIILPNDQQQGLPLQLPFRPLRVQILHDTTNINIDYYLNDDNNERIIQIIEKSIRNLLLFESNYTNNIQFDILQQVTTGSRSGTTEDEESDRIIQQQQQQQFCRGTSNNNNNLDVSNIITRSDIDLYLCYYNNDDNNNDDNTKTKISIDPTNQITILHLPYPSSSSSLGSSSSTLISNYPTTKQSHDYYYPYHKPTQKIIENQIHITIVVDNDNEEEEEIGHDFDTITTSNILLDTINQWWYNEIIQQQHNIIHLPKYCSEYIATIIPTVSIVPWTFGSTTILEVNTDNTNEGISIEKIPFQLVSKFVHNERKKLINVLQKEYNIYSNDQSTTIQQWILYIPPSSSVTSTTTTLVDSTIYDEITNQTSQSILVTTKHQQQSKQQQPIVYIDSRFHIVPPPRQQQQPPTDTVSEEKDPIIDNNNNNNNNNNIQRTVTTAISNLVEQLIASECYNIPIHNPVMEWNIIHPSLSSSSSDSLRIPSKLYGGIEYQQRIYNAYKEAIELADQVYTFVLQLSYKVPIDIQVAEEWIKAYTILQSIGTTLSTANNNSSSSTSSGYDEEYIVVLETTLNAIYGTIHILQKLRNSSTLAEPLTMSIEQYFAILSPLAVPLLLPIILTLVREWKRYNKLRSIKQE